jgi:ABC-type branched-subunit amino acid transport system ATPase component
MKTLLGIIESPNATVVGAVTTEGQEIMLEEADQVPRSGLAVVARDLCQKYGFTVPENPAIPPAPVLQTPVPDQTGE